MIAKITQNFTVKNDNILLIGGCGSGKTRYFTNPLLADNDFTFFMVDNYENGLDEVVPNFEVFSFEDEINEKDIVQKLNKKTNVVANISDKIEMEETICKNVEKTLTTLINKENKRPILCLIDMFGVFDYKFITKEFIKQANEKNIYFCFIVQSVLQVKNKDIINVCGVKLLFGGNEKNTYDYFNIEISENILNKSKFNDCIVIFNGKIKHDKKLIPIEQCALKYRRLKEGLSQAELAELSGIALRCIKEYEQNPEKLNKAQVISVYKLAKALNCSIEQLIIL